MIRYAFERGVKVQIVISLGNEHILNESTLTVNFDGVNIVSYIGDVIDPKSYKSSEEFYEEVCKTFEKDFKLTQSNYKAVCNNVKSN